MLFARPAGSGTRAAKFTEGFSYFFSLRGRKEINPSPSGRVITTSTVSGTHRMIDFIGIEAILRNKPYEAKLRMVFIYRPLNGKWKTKSPLRTLRLERIPQSGMSGRWTWHFSCIRVSLHLWICFGKIQKFYAPHNKYRIRGIWKGSLPPRKQFTKTDWEKNFYF